MLTLPPLIHRTSFSSNGAILNKLGDSFLQKPVNSLKKLRNNSHNDIYNISKNQISKFIIYQDINLDLGLGIPHTTSSPP